MSNIQELIEKQHEMNGPPPVPETPPLTRLDKLLAKHGEWVEARWESVDVVLGGELLTVELGRTWGRLWCNLTDHHPPEAKADVPLGYNRQTLPRDYPIERIKLAEEPTDVDTWQTVYDLLDAEDRTNVSAIMWGLNVGEPQEALRGLLRKQEVGRSSKPNDGSI